MIEDETETRRREDIRFRRAWRGGRLTTVRARHLGIPGPPVA